MALPSLEEGSPESEDGRFLRTATMPVFSAGLFPSLRFRYWHLGRQTWCSMSAALFTGNREACTDGTDLAQMS